MYKIVFVVAVFVFAFQGAISSPVGETEVEKVSNSEIQPKNVAENAETQAPTTVTEAAITTTAPKSGASSSEVCILLVQVSSLALIAKQMLL